MAGPRARLAVITVLALAAVTALPVSASAGTLRYVNLGLQSDLVYTAAAGETNHVDVARGTFMSTVFTGIGETGSGATLVAATGAEDPSSICTVDSVARTASCDLNNNLHPVARVLIEAGDQDDTVSLAGVDESTGGDASDTWAVKGGPGADSITGGLSDDTLEGEDGNDTIDAQGGQPDSLFGGPGTDMLNGGNGTDFIFGGPGPDTIQGGSDASPDTVSYADHASGVNVSLADGSGGNAEDAPGDTLSQVERIAGSPFDDRLEGSGGDNQLFGDAGNDVLVGRGGADVLFGGDGFDAASYEERMTGIDATIGGGTVSGDATDGVVGARDLINTDVEQVIGGSGNDQLHGSNDANTLTGGAGDDDLSGQGGDDTLDGGVGHDTYADTSGVDTVTFAGRTGGVSASIGDGANDGNNLDLNGPNLEDVPAFIENLTGSNGIDTLTGSDGTNRLDGGPAGDILRGKLGPDELVGGTGVDTATYSERAADVSVDLDDNADDGNADDADSDNVHSDVEKVVGGDGNDTLSGNGSANTLDGGAGADVIDGLEGADALSGGPGPDKITSRDTSADDVACGADLDSAVVDLLDTVAADCETLDKPVEPSSGPPPGDNGPPPQTQPSSTQPSSTPPAPDTVGPPLSFAAGTLTLSTKGVATVPVACGASDPAGCTGTVVIETASAVTVSAKRKVKLGSGRFKLAAGKSTKVKVKLGRKGLAVVRKLKRLKVRVTISASDAAGNRTQVQKTYRLSYPRRR